MTKRWWCCLITSRCL